MKSCNSTALALVLACVFTDIEKDWEDVFGLSTDSAKYIRKLCTDLKAVHNTKLLHFSNVE